MKVVLSDPKVMMINCLNWLLVISYVENSINFTEVTDFIQEFDV